MLARGAVGLGEGVVLPSMNSLLARTIPQAQRSSALGAVFTGFHCGNLVGLALTPFLLQVSLSHPAFLALPDHTQTHPSLLHEPHSQVLMARVAGCAGHWLARGVHRVWAAGRANAADVAGMRASAGPAGSNAGPGGENAVCVHI